MSLPDESPAARPGALRVRVARGDDAAALARLAEATFRDTYAADNAPENIEVYVANHFGEGHQSRELHDPRMTTWLAVADGAGGEPLVGYLQLRFDAPLPVAHPGAGSPMVEIARCYVRHDWHGHGVGRLLMDAATSDAAARGARLAWLLVWQRNAGAVAFYRRCGFEVVGESTFALGTDIQQDHVMARPLPA